MKEFKFNENDLDMTRFNISLQEEINTVNQGKSKNHYATGKPRTEQEIRDTIYSSKLCEEYLVQVMNYTYSDKKWHDVVSPDGHLVEVKLIKNSIKPSNYHNYIKGIYNKIKKYNTSRYIFAFKKNLKYELVYVFDTQGN